MRVAGGSVVLRIVVLRGVARTVDAVAGAALRGLAGVRTRGRNHRVAAGRIVISRTTVVTGRRVTVRRVVLLL